MTAATFQKDHPACDLWAIDQSETVSISVPRSHLVDLQTTCCWLQTSKHTQVLIQLLCGTSKKRKKEKKKSNGVNTKRG